MGKLYIIGTGPGNIGQMTEYAINTLKECNIILGYTFYLDLLKDIIQGKEIITGKVDEEIQRAELAIGLAQKGKIVGIVSSGDSAVYGMAGIVLEIIAKQGFNIDVKIIPGITAINSAGSLLGVPFMNDFCSISLSDRLTPEDVILKRVEAAGIGDFVVALYNPASLSRNKLIRKTREIMLKYRDGKTPVGMVRNAYREGQSVKISTLNNFLDCNIDMFTLVVIGNSSTYVYGNYMITPRNYNKKYNI
jgi:precorrin-3B C17-methyltransferase